MWDIWMPRMKDTWQLALFNYYLSHFSESCKTSHILLSECDYSVCSYANVWQSGTHTASALSKHKITTITINLLSPEFLDAFGAPFAIWSQGRVGAGLSTR